MFTKLVTGTVILLLFVFIFICIVFMYMAWQSRKSELYQEQLSVNVSQLKPCGSKPNCVCSEYKHNKKHYVDPIAFQGSAIDFMEKLKAAIQMMQGQITQSTDSYLAVEFKSGIFGFIDDLEIRIDKNNKLAHIRSQSRQGHSDFNENRYRVDALKKTLSGKEK